MLRITTGTAKNKNLEVPDVEGIRPMKEKVKLAIFGMIGGDVEEAMVLDLYAGSGNMGIEALSRGASWADIVDLSREAKKSILKNLQNCNFTDQAEVFSDDAIKFAANTNKKYNIIFLDPFYNEIHHKFLMQNLAEILLPEGHIYFTHSPDLDIPNLIANTNLKIVDQRKYGKTFLTVLK